MNLFDKLAIRRLVMAIINLLNRLIKKPSEPNPSPSPIDRPKPLKRVIDKIFKEDEAKQAIKSKPKKRGKS